MKKKYSTLINDKNSQHTWDKWELHQFDKEHLQKSIANIILNADKLKAFPLR